LLFDTTVVHSFYLLSAVVTKMSSDRAEHRSASSMAHLRHGAFFLLSLPTGGGPGAYRQIAYWLAEKGKGGKAGSKVA